MKHCKLTQRIPTGAPTFVDDLQTLCLYKGRVGTNCATTPSDASLGQHCTPGSSTVANRMVRQKKKDRLAF